MKNKTRYPRQNPAAPPRTRKSKTSPPLPSQKGRKEKDSQPQARKPNYYRFNKGQYLVSSEEIRQYFYCKRIPFFRHVQKLQLKKPYSVKKGTEFHENVVRNHHKNKRILKRIKRAITKPGDSQPDIPKKTFTEQFFDFFIEAPRIHLLGRLDLFEVEYENPREPRITAEQYLKATSQCMRYKNESKAHSPHKHPKDHSEDRPQTINLAQAHKNRSEDHPQNINLTQTPKNHPKQNKNPRPNRLLSRIYPVELKTTDIDRDLHNIHHHMQLTCQALLLEERFGYPVYDAKIIYYDELRKRLIMHKDIEITVDMKTTILKAASDLERSYRSEIIPPTPTHKEKCQGCEFWHICRSS